MYQVSGPPSPDPQQQAGDVLEALPSVVYVTDLAGNLTFYNSAAADLWGNKPALGGTDYLQAFRLYGSEGLVSPYADSPMAISLRERRPVHSTAIVLEKPNGHRGTFLAAAAPVIGQAGRPVGSANLLIELCDDQRDNRDRFFSAIVESSNDAIISKDLNGIITSWNAGAARLFGYSAEEIIGKPVLTLIPEDRHDEEPGILARIRSGERIEHYETIRRRKDASLIDISLTVSPIKNSAGRIIGASKIARDITERRRHQEHQQLLYREMNHRVKNSFALAGALISLSVHTSPTPKDLARSVQQRLAALARAHELAQPTTAGGDNVISSGGMNLDVLLDAILLPFKERQTGQDSVLLLGPSIRIAPEAVTPLALILHEFATNAAKYGSLSTTSGRVEIHWAANDDWLTMIWTEHEGPPVLGKPEQEGFGSLLMRRMLEGQLGGRIRYDWREEGTRIEVMIPMKRISGSSVQDGI